MPLSKDFEHLENAHKLIKDEFMKLEEKYDQLRATYDKSLGSSSAPIIVENIASTSNLLNGQVSLVEKNKKLKVQLKKERLISSQGEKTLNEILAKQKMRAPHQGLGYTTMKNGKEKANPPKNVNFVREGHKEVDKCKKVVVEESVYKENSNQLSAGKANPSYVLCKDTRGDVYAKFIGPRNAFRWYSIWVPKSLVSNAKEPISKWVPKSKNLLCVGISLRWP